MSSLLIAAALLGWCVIRPSAQGQKPSQVLRQLSNQQQKLREAFEKDLEKQKAQPYEWEQRSEPLIGLARERVAGFKIKDWQGEELYNLATLYQLAEMYAESIDALEIYIYSEARIALPTEAYLNLVQALIETEELDEAEKRLADAKAFRTYDAMFLPNRIRLHRNLALAYRSRGDNEKAANVARAGYTLADSLGFAAGDLGAIQESAQQEELFLAATAIAAYERAGKKAEAANLLKLVENFDIKAAPHLKARFQSELAAARIIGTTAPEPAMVRWLDGTERSLSSLRGRVILLDFWAMWCSPCQAAFPQWQSYLTKYQSKDLAKGLANGLEVIGLTRFYGRSEKEENLSRTQELESLRRYALEYKLTWPIAIGKMDDPTMEENFGISAMPTAILIDRRGVVRYIQRNLGEYRKLGKQIEKLLAEGT
jgi:thiol-disulfide isomerase/thioredoxin